jgi:hypothetical protein
VTDLIDPEEFPFTVEEIFAAARRFLPEATADQMAEHLGECGPGVIAARTERRALWQTSGIANADRRPLYGWVYPDELLPTLASLSPDLARRVSSLRKRSSNNHDDPAA